MNVMKSFNRWYFNRMNRRTTIVLTLILVVFAYIPHRAMAGVIEFTEKDEWIAAAGAFTTIDFTGFPLGTFITDQYADLGIIFTDGNDSIHQTCSFVNDCWGLDGNGDISVAFDTPQLWIGADYPGILRIELYFEGELTYVSKDYGVGAGLFLGLVSTQLFDAAVLIDASGEAAIDDLHFGVPTPGSLTILALGFLFQRRRRH